MAAPEPLQAWLVAAGVPAHLWPRLFVRMERLHRLGAPEQAGAVQSAEAVVGVFASWCAHTVARGDAQQLWLLSEHAATELKGACLAYGLRFVDNAP